MKLDVRDVALVSALVLLGIGFGLWFVPLGFIVPGVALLLLIRPLGTWWR